MFGGKSTQIRFNIKSTHIRSNIKSTQFFIASQHSLLGKKVCFLFKNVIEFYF